MEVKKKTLSLFAATVARSQTSVLFSWYLKKKRWRWNMMRRCSRKNEEVEEKVSEEVKEYEDCAVF